MADPLSQLAPPLEPVAPAALAGDVAGMAAVAPWLALALLLVAGVLAWLWWRRGAWARGLRRVDRIATPAQAAEALAGLARRHPVVPPDAWWQALDAVRFGRPQADHGDVLRRLRDDALGFPRQARARGQRR